MSFLHEEAGAVTVDWVVLTAALVGLGLAVSGVISGGVETTSRAIDASLSSNDIIRTSFRTPGSEGVSGDGSSAPFDYTPNNPSTFDQWVASYTAREGSLSRYVYSDAELASQYDLLVSQARDAMAPTGGQNFTSAALRLDQAAGVARAAEIRGIGLNDGSPSVETMVGEFEGAFPD